jgi:hypothetical protein
MSPEEVLAWNDEWGTHDGTVHGHGTQMAGTALYGDLTPLLASSEPLKLSHRVESVKVIPDENNDPPEIDQYGYIFHTSAIKAEKIFPNRTRIYCSAVSDESGFRGMPTEWSGQIDNDCADRERRRLFVISAGNIDYEGSVIDAHTYPLRNDESELCAPAQSWNALSIGAYTDLSEIKHPDYADYEPLAKSGALCPQSRTSVLWDPQWPIKPDIVLEGGNFATQTGNPHATAIDDLQLLSTNAEFVSGAPLTSFGFTSGAAAQAARMCASIAAVYPELWVETIRGLIVHSASHTPEMRSY